MFLSSSHVSGSTPSWSGYCMYDTYEVCAFIDMAWCVSQKCQTT